VTGLLTSLCLSINRLQRIRQPIVSPRVGRRLSAIAFFSLLFIKRNMGYYRMSHVFF